MEIPKSTDFIADLIDSTHEAKSESELPRPHLGASLLGHKCERYLWLNFRWVASEQFSGRMLRLFRRGQNEEDVMAEDLRNAGMEVQQYDLDGKQLRVDFGNHVSGSYDGMIHRGVPQAPKSKHITEMKTHNKKSFDLLLKDGVQKSKFQHYVQMQAYMLGTGVERAIYIAVCKDDDRLYTERVKFDEEVARKYVSRGKRIAMSDRMPEPMAGASASWYECKFCSMYDFCHNKGSFEKNCRTCAYAKPNADSTWQCTHWEGQIPTVEDQVAGCSEYKAHPDLDDEEAR